MSARTSSTTEREPLVIKVGISACLLGENVRFDGGHKRDSFITDTFGRHVEFVPVCPEVELGLGIPRETIRLELRAGERRLVAPKSGRDLTEPMQAYAEKRTRELEPLELSGYILKKDSPSCGMERVKQYDENGVPSKKGVGAFARVLLERFPHLPVEEEGRLSDPVLRESFVERVFAYRRARDLFAGRWTVGDLVRFHTREKLLLLAHRPTAYQELGKLVAGAKKEPRAELARRYFDVYMSGLEERATTRRHVNVLQHMAGYFKKQLDAGDKAEIGQVIEDFRRGLVPLVVPLTLIRHHVRRFQVDYLADQVYLEPHPKELMLRNHV